MKKSKRAVIAKDTIKILKEGHYLNHLGQEVKFSDLQKRAEEGTKLYTPTELNALITKRSIQSITHQTKFVVNNLTTLDAVRAVVPNGNQLVYLNFASARNPGGGFLTGSQAQEESIARATGLYPCLLKGGTYYKVNRTTTTCLYTDHIIYAPQVPIIKDEEGELLENVVTASVITTPAVNAGAVLRNESQEQIDQIEYRMKQRMEMVLAICSELGYETLVLGAWGCGVFRNDPAVIARLFHELLIGKYKGQFKEVIFAIYAKDKRFIEPFYATFKKDNDEA